MRFLHDLQDTSLIARVATHMKDETLVSLQSENDQVLADSLQKTLETLVKMFVSGGFDEVREFIEQTLPETERDSLAPAYLAMLREMLGRIYIQGLDLAENDTVTERQLLFLQDAIDAVGSLPRYGSPVYLSLADYTHIESTGLQIARSPGKATVYLGCAFLVAGIFLLFYLPQRRFWVWMSNEAGLTRVELAGMTNRNPRDFDETFDMVKQRLAAATRNSAED